MTWRAHVRTWLETVGLSLLIIVLFALGDMWAGSVEPQSSPCSSWTSAPAPSSTVFAGSLDAQSSIGLNSGRK